MEKHGHATNQDSFEYIKIGNMRFIGKEFAKNPEIHVARPAEALPELLLMLPEYGTEITALCHLEHHHGGEVNVKQCNMMGYFCKADNHPRFATRDTEGKVTLDYGFYIE